MSVQEVARGATGFVLLVLGTAPAVAQGGGDSLYVDPSGNVGVGTTTPAVPFHVFRTSPTPSLKNMLRLTNNGGVQFLLDRLDGNDWQFSNFGASFEISVPGTPEGQFHVYQNGDVEAARNMIAEDFVPPSSRRFKENIVAVDTGEVLERVASLPISEWSYKGQETRHIGPMAEDFQAMFALGEKGDGLSLTATNGVALAAIQELYAELRKLQRVVEEQRRLIEDLEAGQAPPEGR